MGRHLAKLVSLALILSAASWPVAGQAWELSGEKQIGLRLKGGGSVPIGTVTFTPEGGQTRFALKLDLKDFDDQFLSMREFKCLEGPELQCYVPYPYANPKTVTARDLSWLEHSLIFFFKAPADYGAKLSNGLYYAMTLTDAGIVGTPMAVDLNDIAAPPPDPSTPPLSSDARTEIAPGGRWVEALEIR